jgi:hypothetical protein
MNRNDKKILTSAYWDKALTSEENHWVESELAQDKEMKAQLDEIQQLNSFVQRNYNNPTPPHTLEYNWQRCRARLREEEPASFWDWLTTPGWARRFGTAGIGLVVILTLFLTFRSNELPKNSIALESQPSQTDSHVRAVTLPVSYAANADIDKAWSPKPEVSVSTFSSGRGNVIWLSGMKYRSETNSIK